MELIVIQACKKAQLEGRTCSRTGSIRMASLLVASASKYVYVLDTVSNSWRKIISASAPISLCAPEGTTSSRTEADGIDERPRAVFPGIPKAPFSFSCLGNECSNSGPARSFGNNDFACVLEELVHNRLVPGHRARTPASLRHRMLVIVCMYPKLSLCQMHGRSVRQ